MDLYLVYLLGRINQTKVLLNIRIYIDGKSIQNIKFYFIFWIYYYTKSNN